MNLLDFLKYWLDTHPLIFGTVMLVLVIGIASMLSNIFSKGKDNDSQD